jgi:hypothetical protein
MKIIRCGWFLGILGLAGILQADPALPTDAGSARVDPLPSWNNGPAKRRITEFVIQTTRSESKSYVPPAERIAVFDNDGTLWAEQPMYFQMLFAMERTKTKPTDEKEMLATMAKSHSGMTTEEFQGIVKDWLKTAKHPKTGLPYTKMVYQPMIELLTHLRTNGFKTFIVSGGGVEFMRVFAEEVYGIPPEQVVGSSGKLKYEMREGNPVLVKLPEAQFVNDKEGKPIGIQMFIGRRPVAAFGNSDGDLQMLQWTTAGDGARLALIVHHTDAKREWAYDRDSHIGKLDKALDEAKAKGWIIVNMKRDWNTIFPNP